MAGRGPTLVATTAIVRNNDFSDYEYHFLASRFKQSITVLAVRKPNEIVYEMAGAFLVKGHTLLNNRLGDKLGQF